MTVVSASKSKIPQPLRVPEIFITPAFSIASSRAEQELTVVPLPLPPPVVPAPNPTSWFTEADPQELLGGLPPLFVVVCTLVVNVVGAADVVGLPPEPSKHWEYHSLCLTQVQPVILLVGA